MFRLRVLGGFALEGPTGSAVMLPHRRAQAVMAMLALSGDLGCTREQVIALLWPESDEQHSRHGLRDALHAIRHHLRSDAVRSAGEHLRLDPEVVGSDVRTFALAIRAGRHADAVRSYGGALLDGFHVDDAADFERWLDGERTRLAREYAEALLELASAAERAASWDEAASWWARAVEHDPLNSNYVLHHMHAVTALGDRANAIREGDAHARRLREELDLEPDREILAGIQRIRRGDAPALFPQFRSQRRPATRPSPIVERKEEQQRPVSAAPQRPVARLWTTFAFAALVVLLGAVAADRKGGAPTPPVPRTTVAVLPLQNLSADPALDYFCAGLHEELEAELTRTPGLLVSGGSPAGSIVAGTVQVSGDRLRVIVQLVDPVAGSHLWIERYDRRLGNAFAIQTDIAQRVAAQVGKRLSGRDTAAAAR